jgi:spore germination protein YaaH
VGEGEVQVILQDQLYEVKGLYEDDEVYVDFDMVQQYLNSRFYWDSKENLLLYTTSTAVISASTGSSDYYTNKSKSSKAYPIVKTSGDSVYVALDYVKEFSAFDYILYSDPDRVVITYRFGEEADFAETKSKAKLRVDASIKSDILVDLKEGARVQVLEQGETSGSDGDSSAAKFDRVITQDGVIGYLRKKELGKIFTDSYTTDFQEETYSHILKDESVNLVWHQVTTSAANDGILNLLNATKGVNVIAPTWFTVSGNKGEITSLASDTYVERAASLGVEVWGVCNDFGKDSKIGKVLGQTSHRRKLEKNLIAEAIKYSLDGINIDFEYVKKENGDDFIQFIRELGIMCRNNGIVLSVDNYPPTSYSEYYNRTEQAAVADYVITMAYDEYYAGSEEAGPVSSLSYVTDATSATLEQVPAEQTIIALPFYSRLWKETKKEGEKKLSSEAYGMNSGKEVMTDAGVKFAWDDDTGMNYGEYTADGVTYKMWLEDETSLEAKMKAVTESKVAGVAFWKLGLEDSAVWDMILKYTN